MPQLLDQGDWIEVTGLTPGSWTVVNLDAYSPPANYSGVVLACHRTQLSPDGHDRFGIRAVGDTFNNNESYRYSPTGTTAPHQHFLHGAPDDNGNVEIYAKQLVEFTVYIAGWWLEGEFVGLDNAVNLLPMASTTPVNHQYFEIDLNPLIPVGLLPLLLSSEGSISQGQSTGSAT